MHEPSTYEVLERAASIANIAMLRTYAEPFSMQIAAIKEYTSVLKQKLSSHPPNDVFTRERILAQLDIHRSILAPVRSLPVELLSEIFCRVQNASPLRALQAATVISHVCFTWRTVARGHGLLWTKVIVETMNHFDDYCERFLPIAGPALLELRCDDREILWDLWDRITPYASRWRRVSLEGRLSKLPDLKVLYMENLERLAVDAYDAPMSAELSVLDFVVAPRLRHVALTLDALLSERQLHIPVARALTSLEIDVMTPFPVTYTLPLLRACAETLQLLALKVCHPIDGPDGSYPTSASDTFDLKALTELRLVDPTCALLNHITAPHLSELVLGNVPEYGTHSLKGFLTRDQTSRHLESLRVYTVEEREVSTWIPCLQLMDRLVNLYFDELLSKPEFLQILFRNAERPALLPSLRNIAIWDIYQRNQELQDLIARMCASRANFKNVNGQRSFETMGWIDDSV
ncbi:hypothetical protein EV122DRAFT_222138 [Schizophyllum commune]